MSELVLGPLLRYAGTESASFWVETSSPCEVEVLGHRATTFAVEGHHYALVLVDDLEPGSIIEYDVRLDGRVVWPPDDGRPRPAVHTRSGERRLRLLFGSCRVGDPQPAAGEMPSASRTGPESQFAAAQPGKAPSGCARTARPFRARPRRSIRPQPPRRVRGR